MQEDILKKYILEYLPYELQINFIGWLTGKDGVSEDSVQARQQAAQAYPAFAYEMCAKKDIRDAVEQKKPLVPALAKYYNVSEKNVKRLQGKTRSDLGVIEYGGVKNILRLKEKYFQQFKNNLPDLIILRDYGDYIYNFSLSQFLDYLSLKGGNPRQYIERMRKNSHYDVNDAFYFLLRRLFLPMTFNKIKTHAEKNNLIYKCNYYERHISEKFLIKHTNIKAILDFSERYHRNLFRWEDMLNLYSGMNHISWQPLFEKIDLGSSWMAREIHSVKELKEQGRSENHCVGGYFKSILKRGKKSAQLIFSLEKDGEIKSTIDILCFPNKEEDGCDVKIQQNRAHSNKDPDAEALNFSHHLVEIIKKQPISKLDTYLHHLEDARKEYQKYKTENKYIEECGYNPWNRDILNRVWDEFKPALPRRTRCFGLDRLIEMIPIEDIAFRERKNDSELNPWDKMKKEMDV